VWLAVLVTVGVRSNAAALVAGLAFVMLPAISQAYLPSWTANVLPVLFGIGAISAAKYPDGVLAEQGRRFRQLLLHLPHAGQDDQQFDDGTTVKLPEVSRGDATSKVAEHVL